MENGPGPDLLCVLCCSRCGPCVPCTGPSRDPDQDQLCVLCCSQCGPCVPCVGFSWDLDPTLNDYHWHTTVHWHSTRNSHSTCLSLHSVNDKKTKELTDLCTIILWQATRTTLSMQHGIILELTPTDSDILYTHPTGIEYTSLSAPHWHMDHSPYRIHPDILNTNLLTLCTHLSLRSPQTNFNNLTIDPLQDLLHPVSLLLYTHSHTTCSPQTYCMLTSDTLHAHLRHTACSPHLNIHPQWHTVRSSHLHTHSNHLTRHICTCWRRWHLFTLHCNPPSHTHTHTHLTDHSLPHTRYSSHWQTVHWHANIHSPSLPSCTFTLAYCAPSPQCIQTSLTYYTLIYTFSIFTLVTYCTLILLIHCTLALLTHCTLILLTHCTLALLTYCTLTPLTFCTLASLYISMGENWKFSKYGKGRVQGLPWLVGCRGNTPLKGGGWGGAKSQGSLLKS